jgi:hypothetical protein
MEVGKIVASGLVGRPEVAKIVANGPAPPGGKVVRRLFLQRFGAPRAHNLCAPPGGRVHNFCAPRARPLHEPTSGYGIQLASVVGRWRRWAAGLLEPAAPRRPGRSLERPWGAPACLWVP